MSARSGRLVFGNEVQSGMALVIDDLSRVVPGSTVPLAGVLHVAWTGSHSPGMLRVAGRYHAEHEELDVTMLCPAKSVHLLVVEQSRGQFGLD